MRIGLPVWDGKVSPVFDSASRLMVLDVHGVAVNKAFEVFMEESDFHRRCSDLKGFGVELLICGAISSQLRDMLMALGINVIPWISGQIEAVVHAYVEGSLCDGRFVMPGCSKEQLAEMRRVYYREISKKL